MRVLIAEDSAAPRFMLERAIRELGHECVVTEDGEGAWQAFTETGADVIISDWVMPGLDGDELCRRVRLAAKETYTYFIMLTLLSDPGYAVTAMEAGADDYLKKPFDVEDLRAKLIVATRVTELHARLNSQQQELQRLNDRLFEESRHDPLTKLGNRIALHEHLWRLTATAVRYGHRYSIALLDIDYFKAYNDTCGHLAGDDVLRAVASELASGRQADTAYRYGGEELLLVLPEQRLTDAALIAERVRADIEALELPHPGRGPGTVVSVSVGVAEFDAADGGDFGATLARADAALYRAKDLGRNRVELADCQTETLAA
jgi:diguanylate cyclase (GGDEF)-like protein